MGVGDPAPPAADALACEASSEMRRCCQRHERLDSASDKVLHPVSDRPQSGGLGALTSAVD